MIAKKDRAAYVYYLYASVVKTKLPNLSNKIALEINTETDFWVLGLSSFLSFFHIFSIIHGVV